ncbi:hypothetical protein V6Z12_D06G099500 [Gossypium hirsutum]
MYKYIYIEEKPDPFRVSSTLIRCRSASRQGSDCDGDGADSTNPTREVQGEARVERDSRRRARVSCGGAKANRLLGFLLFCFCVG